VLATVVQEKAPVVLEADDGRLFELPEPNREWSLGQRARLGGGIRPVEFDECPRCEDRIPKLDLVSDQRWGETCPSCHDELTDNHANDVVMTDGGEDIDEIRVGDVCLDLAQGQPVHVINDTGLNAYNWSQQNDYEITENYGNSRFDASDDDRVVEVVYCSNIKNEPSKSYAFPVSRLARVETEAADNGRQVADRLVVEALESLFGAAFRSGSEQTLTILEDLAEDAFGKDITGEGRELAEVNREVEAWLDSQEEEMAEAMFEAYREDHP
jgi:hypothetical protein